MIEKLSEYKITKRNGDYINADNNVRVMNTLVVKINELVDAANSIVSVQEKLIDSRFVVETKHEEPVDTFVEQKKWIGKLCKFWDYDGEEKWFSKLENIDKNSPYSYCASGDWWYKHCEPVSPDDDIIYKKD